MMDTVQPRQIAIVGAGPSGLMAAEHLAKAGHHVTVYDRMASPARKFLIAGRGGLNLTHSEPYEKFITRYREAAGWLAPAITAFPPEALRAWCEGLGEDTFIGSSGRVFPRSMKAVGLLRAWLGRLQTYGVQYKAQHAWCGWKQGALFFRTPHGDVQASPDATLLALGGASWPRLGSDAAWCSALAGSGIAITPFTPSNMGFVVPWSAHIAERFAGTPLKPVAVTHENVTRQGEAMITARGIEGGVIYALSASIRDTIACEGSAAITLDARPHMTHEALAQNLGPRTSKSFSSMLRSAGMAPVVIALLHETMSPQERAHTTPDRLAHIIKALPITLTAHAGIERAISSAGGIRREAVQDDFMLRAHEGVFVAGEMLDWEAPTGGYLLQACFSTAVAAADGMLRYLERKT